MFSTVMIRSAFPNKLAAIAALLPDFREVFPSTLCRTLPEHPSLENHPVLLHKRLDEIAA